MTAAKRTAPKKATPKKKAARSAALRAAPKAAKTAATKTPAKTAATKAPAKTAATKTPAKARKRTPKFDLVIDSIKGAKWTSEPHRPQFEYRHFGVEEATKRKYGSHVIRVAPGAKPPVRHHVHPDCEFLLVYILKGWVKFWYDGAGEKKLVAGDVHLLPAGIRHAVTGWSKDLEMLETTHPADYRSIELTDRQVAALK